MREIELLYKREYATEMLVYYYDVHAWRWDVKFWLVDNQWCTGLDGKNVVGDLTTNQADIIQKYASIIEQHEKENRSWIAFQNCRKRKCVCKSCDKFCKCDSCERKEVKCEIND